MSSRHKKPGGGPPLPTPAGLPSDHRTDSPPSPAPAPQTPATCQTCKFWAAQGAEPGDGVTYGECRALPPAVPGRVLAAPLVGRVGLPLLTPGPHWCGAHAPA